MLSAAVRRRMDAVPAPNATMQKLTLALRRSMSPNLVRQTQRLRATLRSSEPAAVSSQFVQVESTAARFPAEQSRLAFLPPPLSARPHSLIGPRLDSRNSLQLLPSPWT